MKINVKRLTYGEIIIHIDPEDTILKLKEKIYDKDYDYPPENQRLIFHGSQLEDHFTLNYYKIENESTIILVLRLRGGGFVDNIKNEMSTFFHQEENQKNNIDSNKINSNKIKEEKKDFFSKINNIQDENNKSNKKDNNEFDFVIIENNKDKNLSFDENIEFDKEEFIKKYLKRDELNVNLIFFDLKMTNKENYKYFNKFKVDVVGGFHAMDDLNILENYLEKIKEKEISFIIISSGTSGKDVISICKKYSFIKEVIIFCKNFNYNEHYLKEYPDYVKKVLTNIKEIYEYIKTFGNNKYKDGIEKYLDEDKYIFSSDEIKMDKQLQQCPLISLYEYDKCYFLVHKVYSHFFGDINNKYE